MAGLGGYFLNPTTNLAEVAWMVAPEWRGTGLGKAIQFRLRDVAAGRGIRGFTASIFTENSAALALMRRLGDKVDIDQDGDTVEFTVLF